MMESVVIICWLFCVSQIMTQTCYDPTTFCSNSLIYAPSVCKPDLKSSSLKDVYYSYCLEHDRDSWKKGVKDGTSTGSSAIDYDFIICKESFSLCGYVPLEGPGPSCGEVKDQSGVTFGAGIDLGHQSVASLQSLGITDATLAILTPYIGYTSSIAAEKICNAPFTLSDNEAYDLSISLMDKYTEQMKSWYNDQRGAGTLSYSELPKGIRTVLTSIYWRWGVPSSYRIFWGYIKSNEFKLAINELEAWYSDGTTDKRLQSEANIMEASLGCISSIDCVFLLDESGSVGSIDFKKALNWVNEFIQSFDETSLDQTNNHIGSRFGVSTFSSRSVDHIHLDEYSTLYEYSTSVLSIPYLGGGTKLGDALTRIGMSQFIEANGMRAASLGIPRLLIVLTDGRAYDDVAVGVASLQHLNLNIIAIGIANYDMYQLKTIAGDDFIFTIDKYDKLSMILSGVLLQSCYVPTKLNVGDVLSNIQAETNSVEYFEFTVSGKTKDQNSNIILKIKQNTGCVYVYVHYCTRYPSYYVNHVKFTLCSQSFKQIVLSPETWDCSEFEGRGSPTTRRLLQEDSINIYVAVEVRPNDGINQPATYDFTVDTCNSSICDVGTNYDNSLPVDPPYDVSETYSPTNDPTTEPTNEPTTEPTKNPTEQTIEPTINPSNNPSKAPTLKPTLVPSTDPTFVPTPGPTVKAGDPSRAPTLRPTSIPTNAPSQIPTYKPSTNPSVTPTPGPTVRAGDPSRAPTLRPIPYPTAMPTELCESYDIHTIPCECITKTGICEKMNRCYYNYVNKQCKQIDDEYCSTFSKDIYKPCSCFNNDASKCILFDTCIWDQNVCKINGCFISSYNSTISPTMNPTQYPTINAIKFCCNAYKIKNDGICKPIDNDKYCNINNKCYWNENSCLDEACLGRKKKCSSNKDCCSGLCIQFRGIGQCT